MKRCLLLLTSMALLTACGSSLERVRGQSLTVEHADLTHINDGIAIMDVHISPDGFSLAEVTAIRKESDEFYSFPFYDNFILGTKRLKFEKMDLGENQILKHTVGFDVPSGEYQVRSIGIALQGQNSILYNFDDLDDVSFVVPSGDRPAYLGTLTIVLSDDQTPRSIRGRRSVGFSSIDPADFRIEQLKGIYPALKDLDIRLGQIVTD